MAIRDIITKRVDLYQVDPKFLTEEPGWNVRQPGPELDAHVRWLCDSIKEEGVREPLTCWLKKEENGSQFFVVTNGHCRLMAVKLAISEGCDIETVPVRVEDRYSNESDRVLSMITRNSGKPLSQIEIGEVIKRLIKFGWDMGKIVAKTGFSISHIKNMLELSSAPDEILKMVNDGQVSATLATKMVKEKGPEEAAKVLKGAVETSKKAGKQKATEKDMQRIKEKKVSWKKYGPKLYAIMKEIYETPATDKNKVFQKIAEAGEILGEIEEAQGE